MSRKTNALKMPARAKGRPKAWLHKLPAILALAEIEGMTFVEIGRRTGVPVSTVRDYVARAQDEPEKEEARASDTSAGRPSDTADGVSPTTIAHGGPEPGESAPDEGDCTS